MAAFNKFNAFAKDVATKVHNLNSDTLKIILSNTAISATNAVLADITQIANGNGYTTNGTTATFTSGNQTSGTYKLILADVTFTASGGSVGPFQYAVLYNSTAASGNLIGWWDYGSAVTVTTGNSFTVDLDGTNGVLTIA